MTTRWSDEAVGVVGLGTMGTGIAITALLAGRRTVGVETSAQALEAGTERVIAYLQGSVRRGKLSQQQLRDAMERFEGTTDPQELAGCQAVIEAVPEDLRIKQRLMEQLDDLCNPTTLIASNTSTVPISRIAQGSRWPERVVGMHFCNPAPLMPLVEVVRGQRSSDEAMSRALALVRALQKVPVATPDTPGFLVNLFLVPFENDCIRALQTGIATAPAIDEAVRLGLGHPMGPFTLLDIVGLDVHHAVSMSLFEQLHDPRFAPPPLVDRMIAAGQLGRKTGQGFYSYEGSGSFGD